ncbi:MAG: acetyl-CoA carboxylase biotin carboxyl carrier protein subunit [Candidatus Nealsonbacteria bacterium]|nr:acetyl-CoA carboxylase biotin carboxyl carrier protein subunit [Candidatus Nealsonbacteria bacterium]
MQTEIKIKDKIYKIEIFEMEKGLLKVNINKEDYFFTKNKLGELISVQPKSKIPEIDQEENGIVLDGLNEREIRSPIAGIISTIDVKKGGEVKLGQKVVTLIAMKMENEIIAEASGIVKEVKVKESQFVNSGEILILLD